MISEDRAASLKARIEGAYGLRSAQIGRQAKRKGNVIPTGSLALDYMLGIGGYARGHAVEVFGPTTIGKTSIFGFGAIRGAESLGLVTAVIAVEPRWSDEWAERHGVNPDTTVVLFPDHLEEAFEMLRDIVYGNEADFILFDSLGGGTSDKAIQSDKGTQAYGNAALITSGVARVIPRCFKDNITIMYINQIRDKGGGHIPVYHDSPGGNLLRHAMMTRIQVKPGSKKYNVKMNTGEGTEDVMAGRDINAVIKKHNAAESMGRTAKFRFFHVETNLYPFGIDVPKDVLNTGKMTGVIQGTGWLKHPSFPDGKLNGKDKAEAFLEGHPEAVAQIREEVLAAMEKRQEQLEEDKQVVASA